MAPEFVPALTLLTLLVAGVGLAYLWSVLLRQDRELLVVEPYLSGVAATEHAVSRYHVRWYTISMVFLAFDMEMVFMYPWTLVVSRVGVAAVIEMFLFLGILLAGVLYACREGALRWT